MELDEIRALLIEHDEVRDAVVIAQQLDPQNSRLVGYVVPRRDEVSAAKLRQYLAEKLPDFMVPAIYVSIAEMPLTPSGKLDRRALPDVEDPVAREVAYASPRNPWDLQLVRIWERLLNRQNIGIDDNFFELGGHSILALRLMAQIRSAFDQDLPLATLVENPSIRKLTEILRTGTKLRWSFLVPFQAENSEPSFFCVHPIGGQVLCYMDLVRHFGPEQNFYGLQSPRLEDITAESKGLTIETMAQQYLAEMVEVQPQGPYLLGGWSFGGYVAVEIARELRRRGEEVPLLALLDTWTPEIHRVTQDDAFMLLELVKDRARRRDLEVDLSIEQLRAVADDERLEFVLRWVHRHKLVPQELDLSLLRRLLAGYRIRREALQRFRPQPYPGPITLFRAVEEDPLTLTAIAEVGVDIHDPTYGWQHLTPEIVQIFEVPGYHETMCREPYVETLAKQLRNCIRSSLKRVTKHA